MTDQYDEATWAIAKIRGADTYHDAIANLLREKFPEAGWKPRCPVVDGRYVMFADNRLQFVDIRRSLFYTPVGTRCYPSNIERHLELPPDPPATVTVDAEYVRHAEAMATYCYSTSNSQTFRQNKASADYILAAKKGGEA